VKKEDEERMALDRFRQASGLLSGAVTLVKPDPPDLLIEQGGRRIAVEMTRHHQDSGPKGSKQAEQEEIEDRVVAMAQTLFEAAHPGVHLLVSPFFNHGSLNRRDLKLYAERLAHAVAGLIPPLTTEPLSSLSAGWHQLKAEGLDDSLAFLEVSRARASTYSVWDFGDAGRLSRDVGHLLSVVRNKEADLHRYQAGFDECWLIVYTTHNASTFFDFEVLAPRMWKSTFDGVVVIDALSQFVHVA
jgi:hypothetical protein